MLGFSGGRKLIAPGLAPQRTIKKIHSPRFMREARAVEGSIDDNPLRAELLEVARHGADDFMLDVTLTPGQRISGVFAGEPVQGPRRRGCASCATSSVEWLPELVDAVITTAAGHPLDLTFYQTIKGVTAAEHIVKPGGPILTVSECAGGLGSPEYIEMLDSYTGAQSFLDSIADTPVIPDQWQLEKMALVARKHPLFYTPGAETRRVSAVGEAVKSIDEAVASLLAQLRRTRASPSSLKGRTPSPACARWRWPSRPARTSYGCKDLLGDRKRNLSPAGFAAPPQHCLVFLPLPGQGALRPAAVSPGSSASLRAIHPITFAGARCWKSSCVMKCMAGAMWWKKRL